MIKIRPQSRIFVDASTIFVTTSTKLMQKAGQRIDFVPFSSMFLA
jgi:hypothetical protein